MGIGQLYGVKGMCIPFNISKFTFQVETIGDAYMVVSGLPIRNGNKHVREISDMALDIRESVNNFVIGHLSNRPLQIRIGIHTGKL